MPSTMAELLGGSQVKRRRWMTNCSTIATISSSHTTISSSCAGCEERAGNGT